MIDRGADLVLRSCNMLMWLDCDGEVVKDAVGRYGYRRCKITRCSSIAREVYVLR